ncbi:acyl carrier protein [Corynebacterium lubricantis]|uniref:acyl carrier protein n=1 Tax=Corynebacterium lubricantis TaxID=541095 RepID=UPI00036E055A|nr:acyl carrier protein [Corynebacterium lubricantis]
MELSQRININLPQEQESNAKDAKDQAQPHDVEGRLVQLIAETTGIDAEKVTPSSTTDSLGIDSLSRIEIVVRAEETFGVRIEAKDAESFTTIGDLATYLAEHE